MYFERKSPGPARVIDTDEFTGGKNIQHAYQGRTSANRYAEKAIAALHEDWRLSAEFEGMLDGKWKK
jgi:hypothetical protein